MAFPTKSQMEAMGFKRGAQFKNAGRNRWPVGVLCIVLEASDVGTVLVQNFGTGEQTYLKATDLDF